MRRRQRKLIMNICLLVMGIGMIVFPGNLFFAQETEQENAVDVGKNEGNAAETAVPSEITPTVTEEPENTVTPMPTVTVQAMPTETPTPTEELEPTPTITESVQPTPTPEEYVFYEELPEDITALVNSYFEALSTSVEDYKSLIYNPEAVNEDLINLRVSYTVAYHNISCYMHEGTGTIDYVVYVLYDEEIPTITTYAPSIDFLLIRYEEGVPKVYLADEKLTAEEISYINQLLVTEEVKLLVGQVETRMEAAKQSDADLRNFMDNITNQTENSEQ